MPGESAKFDRLVKQIEDNKDLLLSWRRNFGRCSKAFSHTIAEAFNQWSYHGECSKPLIDAGALHEVLRQVVPKPLYRDPFEHFAGRARGINHFHDLGTGQETHQFTNFTYWGRSMHRDDGSSVQHIAVNETQYCSPELLPDLGENKLDLIANLYRADLGVTSWAALRRFAKIESAFIHYEIAPEQALWISKIMPGSSVKADDIFNISFEWWAWTGARRHRYSMLAMNFVVDFDHCKLSISGNTCNEIRYEDHLPLAAEPQPNHTQPLPVSADVPISSSVWQDLLRMAIFMFSFPLVAAYAIIEAGSRSLGTASVSERSSAYDSEFETLLNRIEQASQLYAKWRRAFAACNAGGISDAIAALLAQYSDVGSFPTPAVSGRDLREAFNLGTQNRVPFQIWDFDKTQGLWEGIFHDFSFSTREPIRTVTAYSLWYKGVATHGGFLQKVVGSESFSLSRPDLPNIGEKKVDIFVNFSRPDIGVVGWSSLYQHGRQVQPVVGYKLNEDVILWLSQIMTEDLHTFPDQENVFFISLEWQGSHPGKRRFSLVLFTMEIDFAACTARIFGDSFRKGYFEQQSL